MRALKIAACAAVSLLVVTLLLVAYLFLTAQVEIVSVTSTGASLESDPETFESLRSAVEQETFQGTLFNRPSEWGSAGDYALITYTVRLRNGCLVPIDMIEAQVVPQSQDILQIGDFQVRSLEAKTEGDITASILTAKNSHAIREVIVTYYVWGVSLSVRTTYGG